MNEHMIGSDALSFLRFYFHHKSPDLDSDDTRPELDMEWSTKSLLI